MCLIFLAVRCHPAYPLIVVANRDEFLERATAPAHFWKDHPHVLAGQDLASPTQPTGTWLGVNRDGRLAMLTNYRDPAQLLDGAPSRGLLVTRYLTGSHSAGKDYLEGLRPEAAAYNGFNLIAGTPQELWWFSNRADHMRPVGDGIHGLSNHLLDTPWPKVNEGKENLRRLLDGSDAGAEKFLEAMRETKAYPDDLLPDTGVGIERERRLSATFIRMPGYGTRCSTVIMYRSSGEVTFLERTYGEDGTTAGEARFDFQLNTHG